MIQSCRVPTGSHSSELDTWYSVLSDDLRLRISERETGISKESTAATETEEKKEAGRCLQVGLTSGLDGAWRSWQRLRRCSDEDARRGTRSAGARNGAATGVDSGRRRGSGGGGIVRRRQRQLLVVGPSLYR